MEEVSNRMSDIGDTVRHMFVQFVEFVPDLVGAVLLVLLGWIVAIVLRSAGTQ